MCSCGQLVLQWCRTGFRCSWCYGYRCPSQDQGTIQTMQMLTGFGAIANGGVITGLVDVSTLSDTFRNYVPQGIAAGLLRRTGDGSNQVALNLDSVDLSVLIRANAPRHVHLAFRSSPPGCHFQSATWSSYYGWMGGCFRRWSRIHGLKTSRSCSSCLGRGLYRISQH